ncbi:hypothetical protein F5Y03DRAFT_83957 [Xylaria venustula]|nr:hypothetical protein F5Y03DRAFT_83957 [Xylaria venustula]
MFLNIKPLFLLYSISGRDSTCANPSTSSTPAPLHRLLRSPKDRRTPFLFDTPQPTPTIPPPHRLPHRTSSKVLPLVEGESRRPRQIASGSGSYRFRPP